MLNADEISVDKIKSGFGGYKKKETKEYLETIRSNYDALWKENLELKDKLSVLSEGVQYYKNMEKSLQKALVLAERTTSETVHAAEVKAVAMEKEAMAKAENLKKEAELQATAREREAALKADSLIRDAKRQADTAIAEGNEELRKVHSQIMTLIQQYEQYKTQYKQLAMAQMNVLESKAYNLEAPILKTIQSLTEDSATAEEDTKEDIPNSVVHPVETVSEPLEENETEKKVYVDGRGQVVEVHEFREVTPMGNENDPINAFDTDTNNTKTEEDSWSKSDFPYGAMSFDQDAENVQQNSEKTEDRAEPPVADLETINPMKQGTFNSEISEEKNPDVYFKAFEPSSSSVMNNQTTDEKKEDNADMQAEMKRIERLQMERLQREEELQAERMRNRQSKAEYNEFSHTTSGEMEQNNTEDNTLSEEATESPVADSNFYSDYDKIDKPDLTLSDIKRMDDVENSQVPLPSASEEEKYFTRRKNDKNEIAHDASVADNSTNFPHDINTDYFNQFAPDQLSALHSYAKENETNSIDYELDHNSTQNNAEHSSKFKSFKDFESEL